MPPITDLVGIKMITILARKLLIKAKNDASALGHLELMHQSLYKL